ncbi:MAG: sigma-70 family RNA polymerase sigma factor [Rhodospirillaceae bacterium]
MSHTTVKASTARSSADSTTTSVASEVTTIGPEQMGALIVRIAEVRCKTSFGHLYGYYQPRLKAYLRRQGANDAVAEDLAQEAMLTLWRKADRYDPAKASAGTWLFTIARNLRIDLIRKERRPEVDPEDPMLVPDPPETADVVMEGSQRDTMVRQAIQTLPKDQAEVLTFSFYEDLTHTEIAERLNLPLGTVKSRLRLAFQKVRTALGDQT